MTAKLKQIVEEEKEGKAKATLAQCILDRTVGDLSVKTPGEPSGVV